MAAKTKSMTTESLFEQIGRIERILKNENQTILEDLEKKPSLRKYSYEDLSKVVNDIYKLTISKDILHKLERRERFSGIDRRFK